VRVVVTVPAYNEEKTIAAVIREIPRDIPGIESVEVIVIDDGSTEGTVGNARESGADHIVSHKKNQGLGVTFRDGLDAALEMGADIIVNIDGDGQYNAKEIPKLIAPLLENRADMVIGWRHIKALYFMPVGKRVGNTVATWLTNILSGASEPIKDAQSGFRAFSKETALRMNLSGRYTYVQETLMEAISKGLKIEQVPIEFRPREGKSRLIRSLPTYALRAGKIVVTTYWRYHPMRIFGIIGAILMAIGVSLGIRVLVHFVQTGTVSPYVPSVIATALFIAIGVQSMILGLFAETMRSQRVFQEEILYRLRKRGYNGNRK
jgi:glycosyltransferase involved in cell wall biosynthesis